MADSGLNAQCLRRERFLRVNSCGSKRRFEGIWTDVSCIFDRTFGLISISENCISIVEHGDCSPQDQLESGKRLVIRDSEIYVFEMFGVFAIQSRCLDILVINLNSAFCDACKIEGTCCGPCCMLCAPIFSSISSPGMMDLQNEVLVAFRQSDHSSASAPRRCNRCAAKLQPLRRKHLRRGVKSISWRCCAGELLRSCWGRLRMSVVIAAAWIRFWGLE